MSHEFDDAEMMPCDICGEFWPGGEMTELEDGRLVCPDCIEDLEQDED